MSLPHRWARRALEAVIARRVLVLVTLGTATLTMLIAATVHDLAIYFATTWVAELANSESLRRAVVGALGDEVYARLILAMVGNIQTLGLAIGQPLGTLLIQTSPAAPVSGNYLTTADLSRVVFTSGSSAVGVQLIQTAVNLGIAAAGTFIATLCRHKGASGWGWRSLFLCVGIVLTSYGAGAQLQLSWANGSGGEMALSMVSTKLFGLDGTSYGLAMSHGRAISMALNLVLLGVAAGAAAGLVLAATWVTRLLRPRKSRARVSRLRVVTFSAAGLLVVLYGSVSSAVAYEDSGSARVALPSAGPRLATMVSAWPSVVAVQPRAEGGWDYTVNGHHDSIRGIGYNAVTTNELPEQRRATFDRDFASIKATGANTLVGWSEAEFDDLLLQEANAHGLGVILPFKLGPMYINSEPDYAYEDPAVRQQLLEAISARVKHYRNNPALRMWGLGNEVLHAIAWAHGTPAHAQAFADFLVEAADRVHELDPNHPVVYRDAEDWYLNPIVKALDKNWKARPWFIYGMNFFTTRMSQALDSGPAARLNQPIIISEFGPVGLRPEARPNGYRDLWNIIVRHRAQVLGGCAYVWSTAGPEPLDRTFGLTDPAGKPVDGSLAELAALF